MGSLLVFNFKPDWFVFIVNIQGSLLRKQGRKHHSVSILKVYPVAIETRLKWIISTKYTPLDCLPSVAPHVKYLSPIVRKLLTWDTK